MAAALFVLVSIHAPAGGATWREFAQSLTIQFQSTRPQGARRRDVRGVVCGCVSIHAPAGGATRRFTPNASSAPFQSTRPQGARLTFRPFRERARGFNPRARRGRDAISWSILASLVCFNPRARRGRDKFKYSYTTFIKSFNPRARRGRDGAIMNCATLGLVSIHAPAGGATPKHPPNMHPAMFQSTRPQGARHSSSEKYLLPICFNPRARRGRDTSKRISI